jgi:hypothetical protein
LTAPVGRRERATELVKLFLSEADLAKMRGGSWMKEKKRLRARDVL